MTNKGRRLGRLERVVDLDLEARARWVLGLGEGSVEWAEIRREYREVSELHAAIRERLLRPPNKGACPADIEAEARTLAQDLGLDSEGLMAEAGRLADRGVADRQAVSWLLSHL